MIVGNPNAGRRMATAAITILVMLILITVVLSARKKNAPVKELKEPPLHPSIIIKLRFGGLFVE